MIKTLPMHDAEHQQASQAELFAVEHLSLHDPQAPLVKTEVGLLVLTSGIIPLVWRTQFPRGFRSRCTGRSPIFMTLPKR